VTSFVSRRRETECTFISVSSNLCDLHGYIFSWGFATSAVTVESSLESVSWMAHPTQLICTCADLNNGSLFGCAAYVCRMCGIIHVDLINNDKTGTTETRFHHLTHLGNFQRLFRRRGTEPASNCFQKGTCSGERAVD